MASVDTYMIKETNHKNNFAIADQVQHNFKTIFQVQAYNECTINSAKKVLLRTVSVAMLLLSTKLPY